LLISDWIPSIENPQWFDRLGAAQKTKIAAKIARKAVKKVVKAVKAAR